MHPLSSRPQAGYQIGGMYDDVANNIRNDQRPPPDPNPSIDCAACGEAYKWKDYWKPKVTGDGRIENPHEEPWLCDPCHAEKMRMERRRENNRDLGEFV